MNLNTLSLYLYAGGLSLSLCIVLLVLKRLRPGTRLLTNSTYAIFMLGFGFIVSGFGSNFPPWATVIGTNLVLLGAFSVFYSGVNAFVKHQQPRVDWFGVGLLALCALAFGYWGLVESNGVYRSIVFSAAAAVIHGRTTYLLARTLPGQWGNKPHLVLTALFGISAVWMLGRTGVLWLADVPSTPSRGNNPTAWITVFWYIVLVTSVTACVVWAELSQHEKNAMQASRTTLGSFGLDQRIENNLLVLWTLVFIALLGGISEMGVYYTKTHAAEQARLTQATELANVALANQTRQVMSQVDTLLHSVRGFYLSSQSIEETETFINALPFDKTVIENVYLISPRAEIVISHDPGATGRSVADRDYFVFLKSAGDDEVFLGSAELGRVNQQLNFRVARRITKPDGSFAGVVLATVRPESFSRYHEKVAPSAQSVAVVLGILDRKFRGRTPALPPDRWQTPLESPLWELLKQSPSGTYTSTSTVDNIQRIFVYRKVDDWPLVVATGFSESDIHASVQEQLRWFAIAVLAASAMVVTLATLLTIEVRRRDEQDRFLSMLSHELKTPLATIAMTLGSFHIPDAISQRVTRSIGSMSAIIERCLQSDRLAHGRVSVYLEACDISALVDDVRVACSEPQRVIVSHGDISPARTDRQLFSVIVSNLMDNALKYGASGVGVKVAIDSSAERGAPGLRVIVSNPVGTSGVPDAKCVFKKYYRASGAQGKVGSGLGLHIAHGFARKIGGQLRYAPVADTVNFELWIPI